MKFSAAFTALVVIIPLLSGQALAAGGQANKGKGQVANVNNGGKNTNNNGGAKNNGANNTAANNTAVNNTAANNTAANSGDPQTSLTLDPKVIAAGFANNGQQTPTAGQVASLTSTNNFINFCLTVPNKPITNGQQVKTGSCNPAPMGIIAATTNMPHSKFTNPLNGQDLPPNQSFDITMAVANLETGNFVNADSNYYAAPQQVNAGGDIIGHSHFTVSTISSFTDTTPNDPNKFPFFKGVNTAAVNGVVTEPVTGGLPKGFYRLCSINTDANHAPCLVAVAQHGSLDDCVYFSVGEGAGANVFGGGGNANNNTAANGGNANNNTAANGGNSTANGANGANGKNAGNGGANGKNAGNGGANGKNANNAAKAKPPPKAAPKVAPKPAAPKPAVPKPVVKPPVKPIVKQTPGSKKAGRRMVARLARDH